MLPVNLGVALTTFKFLLGSYDRNYLVRRIDTIILKNLCLAI